MIASIYLNDKHKEYEEVWEKAREALNMFIDLNNLEGRAEAHFLIGMLFKKKIKRSKKQDSLKLKKQPKSEMKFDKSFDSVPNIQRSSSNMRKISEEEKDYLEVALQQFVELKHKYGIARVSLAIAINTIESDPNLFQQILLKSDNLSVDLAKEDYARNMAKK